MRYAAIKEHKARYPVRMMCVLLSVSHSGYYRWKRRKPSLRSRVSAELLKKIATIHQKSRQRYGSPRIHARLLRDGERVSRNRVVRPMQRHGTAVMLPRKFKSKTK